MAKVEMDLAELKQLEKQIEDLQKEKQTLLDNQQQVVIYHKYFNGKIKHGEQKNIALPNRQWERVTFKELLDNGVIEIDVSEDTHKITKDYKNLSEVISEIKKEEEQKVEKDIIKLKDSILIKNDVIFQLEQKLENLKNNQDSKILNITNNLIEEYDKKIINLTKEKDKIIEQLNVKYNQLSEEFEEFKINKKRVTLEEQLNTLIRQNKELKEQINIIKNKSFFKRLFNK